MTKKSYEVKEDLPGEEGECKILKLTQEKGEIMSLNFRGLSTVGRIVIDSKIGKKVLEAKLLCWEWQLLITEIMNNYSAMNKENLETVDRIIHKVIDQLLIAVREK